MKASKFLAGIVVAALAVFLFTGCVTKRGSLGIKDISVHEIDEKMKKGKTTQNDVVQLYGNPTKKSLDNNGNEQWEYAYSESRKGFMNFIPYAPVNQDDTYTKTLHLSFNRKTKLLTDYYVTEEGVIETENSIGDGSSFDAGVK